MNPKLDSPLFCTYNDIIDLSIHRKVKCSLKDADGRVITGNETNEKTFSPGCLNKAFLYLICSLYESYLESVLLNHLHENMGESNVMYPRLFKEITMISGLGKYKDFASKYFNFNIDISLAAWASFEMRNVSIHGSTRLVVDMEKDYISRIKELEKLNAYLKDKYTLKCDVEITYLSVRNCNAVFNDLFLDIFDNIIFMSKSIDTGTFFKSYSTQVLTSMKDVWVKTYLPLCG